MNENQIIVNEGNAQLQSWLAGAQKITDDYMKANFAALEMPKLSLEFGPRYVRMVRSDAGSRSVHAFIDRRNGDVLKAAGWKAPAKHARGNIFDADNGLKFMGQYGPAYLR